ncbi:hypothetical protein [Fictibacillus sp. S7]|uniref:hypothetical protein n=1 Tax=Fictibacillus sp. S7 TaxID=2212476 RepID=UPI0010136A1E|nr:hypothetical protein [Fictibacillus sp. S7]RXY98882.1 hypothetical protein DMO16_03890 [Fictibacillus sp. S7]
MFNDKTIEPKKYNHKFTQLFNEVKAINKEYPWDTFDELISRFYQHYQSRYPENKDKSMYQSTEELNEIDKLVFALNQNMPVPEEIKLRSGLFIQMTTDLHFGGVNWATINNHAIDLDRLSKEANKLLKHLYGDNY